MVGQGAVTRGWLVHFAVEHEVGGGVFQRGKLIAVIGKSGFFESDLSALAHHKHFCAGNGDEPVKEAENAALGEELIAAAFAAADEICRSACPEIASLFEAENGAGLDLTGSELAQRARFLAE